MRVPFRPLPGLTLITLIMLAILVRLGYWQSERLEWKTNLLAEIDQAANAAPLTSLAQISEKLKSKTPVDFRRFELAANYLSFDEPLRVYTSRTVGYGWRLFSPVAQNGQIVYAAGQIIDDGADVPSIMSRQTRLAGYVRIARDVKPRTRSTPSENRWYGFDPLPETDSWSNGGHIDTAYYLDVEPQVTDASTLPPKKPNIRNNHYDYMLTWYGLALVLLIFYVIIHKREGRIGWS